MTQMKRVIRCCKCAECYVYSSIGFFAKDQLWCPNRQENVEPYDGCTFGTPGKPVRARKPIFIDISQNSIAGGMEDFSGDD